MKKIAMSITNDFTHDSRVKREALALIGAGYHVDLVAIKSKDTESAENQERINIHRVQPAPWKGIFGENPINTFRYLRHLFKYGNLTQKIIYDKLVTLKADIYHAHDFDTLMPAAQAAKVNKSLLVYDSHELFTETIKKYSSTSKIKNIYLNIVINYIRLMEKRYIRKADGVITVNEPIAQLLKKWYGIDLPTVVMNTPDRQEVENIISWQKIYNLPDDSKIILYQGVFGPDRGILPMIESICHLPRNYYQVFLGYGEFKKTMDEIINKNGWQQRVFIHPAVDPAELLPYTAGADLGVALIEPLNLSKKLASPNKIFEYMMSSIPVICSNLPVMAPIVNEWKNGLLVDELKPEVIAEKIVKILSSPDYNLMSQNSKKAAWEKYNWQVESKKLIGLYDSLESKG
ncbi:glycosyltransferase family 4 protein [Patescibacteria group bacterium]|nr:glycosyltransferase family 4 protein [Patescibacteria group bacterium]